MKVRIGEFDVECTVEEFEKLRKAKLETPKTDPAPQPPASTIYYAGTPINLPEYKPVVAPLLRNYATPGTSPKGKVVRGVKSLVVGTVGKYGMHGLTLPQIITMSGLTRAQVKSGVYAAMYAKDGVVLLREENDRYYCTPAGESYAIASNFGEVKIVQEWKYMPKEGA